MMASFVAEDDICVLKRALLFVARQKETLRRRFFFSAYFTSVSEVTAEKIFFLNSGMAVSTACKFDKLSPHTRPQQRCVSALHKSRRVAQHPPAVIYLTPESCSSLASAVVSVYRLFERPAASTRSHRSAYSTAAACISAVTPSRVGGYGCLLGEGGGADGLARAVGSKPPQILDS